MKIDFTEIKEDGPSNVSENLDSYLDKANGCLEDIKTDFYNE